MQGQTSTGVAPVSPSQSVDTYIASFPPEVQAALGTLRATIRKVIPEAEESISYGVPVFKQDGGYVVYFAGWKQHLSLYPILEADEALEAELAPYRSGRGTLRFKLGEPLPTSLIERVVTLLAQQRRQRAGR